MWRPNIDGYVIPDNYSEALRNNSHVDISILTGNNKDEPSASPDLSYTASDYHDLYSNLFGDLSDHTQASESAKEFYRDLSHRWAVDWAAGGAKSNVYTYYFNHTPDENRDEGAYHGSELWYTFNNIAYALYSNVAWNSENYAVENKLANYRANFIRTGNLNGNVLPQFKPTTRNSQNTMWLGDSWGMGPLTMEGKRIQLLHKWTARLPSW
ncbi:Carboxylesterase type B [Penicillium antarcticum]|uniref:Carboxylesterase type B n=1 Tax=Penicillium antarcticum TaxID=416450 RepID=UPI00238F7BC7|nr:Carboxylesterase type B [Penicillium antarcticum]KAJ5298093.1 Carboxylesterase type B [Penicillium antarcticum]